MAIMNVDDDDQFISDDEEADDDQYAKLQASISQLDSSQRIRSAKRNELGSLISEYHVNDKSGKGVVHTNELASVLGEKKNKFSKKVSKVASRAKTLPKPLEKPVAEQIKRRIGFELVKKQLKSWDAVVESNRVADHLVFPLNESRLNVIDSKAFFSNKTALEKELNEVLHGSQPEVSTEEKDEFPLTLEEIVERRKELAGIRARQSYKEAKAYRQSKIKSKKYHRMQKREKIKQQMKEFEMLQKTDPAAALEKLKELEKSRAEERATLRHRNTGKWAQSLAVRAKYDKESRKVLAEQLSISRDIAMKTKEVDSSEDEAEPDPTVLKEAFEIAESNPWSLEVSSEVNSFISGFRKYWNEKNGKVDEEKKLAETRIILDKPAKEPVEKLKLGASDKWTVSSVVGDGNKLKRKFTDIDLDEAFYLADQKLAENISKKFKTLENKIKPAPETFKKKKSPKNKKEEPSLKMKKSRWHVERAEVDQELGDSSLLNVEPVGKPFNPAVQDKLHARTSDVNIDLDKYLKVKPKVIKTAIPDDVTVGDDEGLEDDDQQQKIIMEAFADDNVTDFKKAKEEAEKETQPEIVAELPGWGSWGGAGIAATKRRRRRFMKMPDLPARKDAGRADVIINENANKSIQNHMVKEVPFPFKSVDAFEANIRAPVSREFVPELTHRALVRPAIITRQGTIIEPMSDEVLIRNRPKPKSLYQAKTKKAKPV